MGVFQQACPMWVPLIETMNTWVPVQIILCRKASTIARQSPFIDTILLGCTLSIAF
jgi:glutamate racemase